MKLKLNGIIKNAKKYVKKNAASGLTLAAIAGVIVTAYYVKKETPEANKKLEENKDANIPEKAGILIGAYPKSFAAGGITIGCIYGANYLNQKNIAALSAICATQASKNITIDKKMREIIGKEKTDEVNSEAIKEYIDKHPELLETAIRTGKGNVLCYEPLCAHFFYSSEGAILKDAANIDKRCKKFGDDYVEANSWMNELGLPDADILNSYGWPYDPTDDSVAIYCTADKTKNGTPYLVINYMDDPIEFGS